MPDPTGADLGAPRAVHLVGVGGAGISAIGIILAAMGHRVTGSDVNETAVWPALIAAGVEPEVVPATELFSSARPHGAEIVAHSTAFPPTERDLAEAAEAGCAVLDRAGILALVCAARPTVAVSGTHGKTSTTAMLATLLDGAGADPSYLVGATPLGLGRAAHWSEAGAFAVEADESDGTFLRMGADIAVVTNIDEDHLDFWHDIAAIEAAFLRFLGEARTGVVCIDDPRGEQVTDPRAARVAAAVGATTVGEGPEADFQVHSVEVERLHTRFGLRHQGRELGPVTVGTPGRHHARNAAVSVAVALELGISAPAAVEALAGYVGVTRRFEVVGEAFGATLVDDYAHNPGKVRALLASAKEAGWPRVVAVFQPHRYTRTRDLLADFGAALALADVIAITEVYAAGEDPIAGISGRLLVEEVLEVRPWAEVAWVPTLDDAAGWARATLRPGDLFLTVGAGDVWQLGRRLIDLDAGGSR
ncbi:UDP-N-acetylmuramate--L-alanine ligase [Aquihabitans sp. McL0605]|uniref:UDP-N-acetylmuramate--L-alanine ligase n=1 Tax=Aquihabitans sp. McL0605 TaxID=3415671 RepID=UPI003CFB6BE4